MSDKHGLTKITQTAEGTEYEGFFHGNQFHVRKVFLKNGVEWKLDVITTYSVSNPSEQISTNMEALTRCVKYWEIDFKPAPKTEDEVTEEFLASIEEAAKTLGGNTHRIGFDVPEWKSKAFSAFTNEELLEYWYKMRQVSTSKIVTATSPMTDWYVVDLQDEILRRMG